MLRVWGWYPIRNTSAPPPPRATAAKSPLSMCCITYTVYHFLFPSESKALAPKLQETGIAFWKTKMFLALDLYYFNRNYLYFLFHQVHIQKVLEGEGVRSRWIAKFGQPPTEADVDRMYERFVPLQKESLKSNSQMIPGKTITAWGGGGTC